MDNLQTTQHIIISINALNTLAFASIIALIGNFLIKRVGFLYRFTIPGPVAGGLLIAIICLILRQFFQITITFETQPLQGILMLMFFASVGFSANIAELKAGGRIIAIFLLGVTGLLILQNIVGVSLATLLDQNPLMGLLAGSITLSGGHGTGASWGPVFVEKYGYQGAVEIAMACATFGLVLGGLVGGPTARFLIARMGRHEMSSAEQDASDEAAENTLDLSNFEKPQARRKVNTSAMLEAIAMLTVAAAAGTYIYTLLDGSRLQFPTFVFALFSAVVIGNIVPRINRRYHVPEKAISVSGNICLSLFLTMALMSLKLWELIDLALPMLVILTIQTIIMVLYAVFVTYVIMGRNYDAAVLAAGHCGFGLGATPTAIANMQVVTDRYGPSHMAFIVVPMVGAFFIDILNAFVIQGFLSIPIFSSMLLTLP